MSADADRKPRGRAAARGGKRPSDGGAVPVFGGQGVLRTLIESLPDGLIVADADGRILAVNATAERMFGYTREELAGREVEVLLPRRFRRSHTRSRADYAAHPRTRVMASGLELVARRKDGTEFPVDIALSPSGEGADAIVTAVVRDISECERAEEALRESEQRFRRLAENADDIIYRYRLTEPRGFEYISPAVTRITGYTPEEHYADPGLGLKIVHPDDRDMLDRYLQDPEAWQAAASMRWFRKDGSILWAEQRNVPVFDAGGALIALEGVSRDITERVRADEALRESEERYRSLFDAGPDGVAVFDADSRLVMINQAGADLYGYGSPEEMIGANAYDFVAPEDRAAVAGTAAGLMGSGGFRNAEWLALKKDGTRFSVEASVRVILDAAGNSAGFVAISRDITGRVRATAALRESEATVRGLLEAAAEGVVTVDGRGRIVFMNAAAEAMFGYDRDELTGKPIEKLVPSRVRKIHGGHRGAYLSAPDVRRMGKGRELSAVRKDGAEFPVEISLTPVDAETGVLVMALISDITERKRVEEALCESEDKYRSIVETSREWIWSVDLQGLFTYCNEAVHAILGYEPEELLGSDSADLLHPDDRVRIEGMMPGWIGAKEGWTGIVARTRRKDGTYRHLESNGTPIMNEAGEVAGYRGADRDVTARIVAEDALRQSEERHRELVENINDIIFALDMSGAVTYISPVVEQLGGYKPAEITGRPFTDFIHPDDVPELAQSFQRVVSGNPEPSEYRMLTNSGEVRWIRSSSRPIMEDGRVAGLRGVLNDITERKRAEEALLQETAFTDTAINSLPGMFYVFDDRGRFVRWNRRLEEVSGYSAAEVARMSPLDFIAEKDHQTVAARIREVFTEGRSEAEGHFLTKRGAEIPYLFTGLRFESGGRNYLAGMGLDVTERRRAQEALRESEERYRFLVEASPDAIILQSGPQITFANDAAARLVGASSADDMVGASVMDFVHPDHHEQVTQRILEAQETRAMLPPAEVKVRRVDGTLIDAEVSGGSVVYQGASFLQATIRDVTARKRAEEALRESEERYRLILDNVQEVIYRVTLSNDPFHAEVMFVGGQVEKVLGYSAGEFVDDQGLWGRILHQDDVPAVMESAARLAAGESLTRQYRLRHKATGEYRWMEDRAVPLVDGSGKVIGQQGVARDLTERKVAEDALRESEERFSKAFHSSSTAIVISTLDDGRIIDINECTLAMFGYTRDEALGRTTIELGAWVDLEDRAHMVGTLREQGHVRDAEYRLRTRHGETLDVLMSVEPIDLRGEPCMLAMFYDVTERKRAEEALRESEERFRNLVETAVDVVFTLAADATLSSLNPAFETITGWRRDQWLGKPFAPIIHPDDLPRAVDIFRRILIGETPLVYELRVLTSAGDYLVAEFHNSPLVFHGAITGTLGIARDITERKRQEEERNRLLGELERLAHRLLRIQEEERRQVAYDIHDGPAQQMVAADMYLESYKAARETAGNEYAEGYLERAASFLSSAIKDTRRIMSGLRPSVLDDLGLVPALRQYLEETGERTDRKVTFSGKIGEERLDPALEIAIFRITQEAVTNAIKHSGTGRISVSLKKASAVVSLEVRDWGAGFDEAETTREGNGGDHGMGLVSMRERAELLGGRFEIESAPGFGTIIRVTIPVSERL